MKNAVLFFHKSQKNSLCVFVIPIADSMNLIYLLLTHLPPKSVLLKISR